MYEEFQKVLKYKIWSGRLFLGSLTLIIISFLISTLLSRSSTIVSNSHVDGSMFNFCVCISCCSDFL